MISEQNLADFKDLFQGLDRAYGIYDLTGSKEVEPGKKVQGRPITVRKPLTDQLWLDHLNGVKGLGVVPIKDDSTCHWGAIDIDVYKGLDSKKLAQEIYSRGLPLIPFRSKSGGVHLYLFLALPVKAKLLVTKLRMMAEALGHAKAEVFPKQTAVLSEKGDIGNWINIGYYNAENSDRYAYGIEGEPLSLEQFLAKAKTGRMGHKELSVYTIVSKRADMNDGPPCLQRIAESGGFQEGTRNDGLFSLAVYCKNKDPENWVKLLEEIKGEFLPNPLSRQEEAQLIASVSKGKYFYRCDISPCSDFCNKKMCAKRKYGIGHNENRLSIVGVTKLETDPPLWFVEIEGHGRVEMTTDELRRQELFQKKCLEKLNKLPPMEKTPVWQSIVADALVNVTVIVVAEDTTPTGFLKDLLITFCTRHPAHDKAELTMGKAYTEAGKTYFRFTDFALFLERQKFNAMPTNKIVSFLKALGAEHTVLNTKDRDIAALVMPEIQGRSIKVDTPKIEGTNVI